MVTRMLFSAVLIAACAVPAVAAPAEIGYPRHSLGYAALMSRDYITAERQLRAPADVAASDPARLINLGTLLIRTGRQAEGADLLKQARKGEDIELVLSDGQTMWSHDVARRALATVTASYAGR